MKILYLLRHGKSSWENASLNDFDRPLNDRGDRESTEMGKYMLENNYIPDIILSSPSERTTETTENIVRELKFNGEIKYIENLYLASSSEIREVIENTKSESALIIGHNPGLETLLNEITKEDHVMKTSHLAVIDLEKGELIKFIRPKDF